MSAGKTYLVGERGPELFTPMGSGMIIPNSGTGVRVPRAQITIIAPQQFDLRGAVMTADLVAEMDRRSQVHARHAGATAYQQSMRDVPKRVAKFQKMGT